MASQSCLHAPHLHDATGNGRRKRRRKAISIRSGMFTGESVEPPGSTRPRLGAQQREDNHELRFLERSGTCVAGPSTARQTPASRNGPVAGLRGWHPAWAKRVPATNSSRGSSREVSHGENEPHTLQAWQQGELRCGRSTRPPRGPRRSPTRPSADCNPLAGAPNQLAGCSFRALGQRSHAIALRPRLYPVAAAA